MIDYTNMDAVKAALSPPTDDEDRQKRTEGWKAFIGEAVKQMQGNPNLGQVLSTWGAQMAQPIRPGDTKVGRASRAMTAVGDLKAQEGERAKELLKLGMDMRQLDQADERMDIERNAQELSLQVEALRTAAGASEAGKERASRERESRLDRESRESIARQRRELDERLKNTLSADAAARLEAAIAEGRAKTYTSALEAAIGIVEAESKDGKIDPMRVAQIANILARPEEAAAAPDPIQQARKEWEAASEEDRPALLEKMKKMLEGVEATRAAAIIQMITGGAGASIPSEGEKSGREEEGGEEETSRDIREEIPEGLTLQATTGPAGVSPAPRVDPQTPTREEPSKPVLSIAQKKAQRLLQESGQDLMKMSPQKREVRVKQMRKLLESLDPSDPEYRLISERLKVVSAKGRAAATT